MMKQATFQFQRTLEVRMQSIVDSWVAAIISPDSEPKQEAKLREQLSDLVKHICSLLFISPLPEGEAERAGMVLASIDGLRPEALTNSQKILITQFLQGITGDQAGVLYSQLALLVGHFTLGFVQQAHRNHKDIVPVTLFTKIPEPDKTKMAVAPTRDKFEELVLLLAGEIAETQEQLQLEIAERRRTERDLRERIQELKLFSRATQVFNYSFDIDQILDSVLDEVRALMGAYAYSAWLVDRDAGEVVCWRVTEEHSRIMLGWRLKLGSGVVGWVAKHGIGVIVEDTRRDSRHFKGIDRQLEIETRSILSVPLRGRQAVIGVLQVVDVEPHRFSPVDKELMEFLAATAGIAVENAQQYEQTRRDAESKSVLLREINHRAKNNLTLIRSIFHLKRSRMAATDQASYHAMTEDIMNYVQGLATVHQLLSNANWSPIPLSELTTRVIETCIKVLSPAHYVAVSVSPSPVWVTADQAHDLALILNELMTNTAKYATPDSRTVIQVTVEIRTRGGMVRFEFKDNGVGYPKAVLSLNPEYYNLGLELVENIVVNSLDGQLSLHNDQGAVTVIDFPIKTTG